MPAGRDYDRLATIIVASTKDEDHFQIEQFCSMLVGMIAIGAFCAFISALQ